MFVVDHLERWRTEIATESGEGEALGYQTYPLHLKHGFKYIISIQHIGNKLLGFYLVLLNLYVDNVMVYFHIRNPVSQCDHPEYM